MDAYDYYLHVSMKFCMHIGDSDGAKYFHFTLTVILRLAELCRE